MSTFRLPSPARARLRFVGMLIAVAGLFGMHGLTAHGVQSIEQIPGTVVAGSSTAGPAVALVVAASGPHGPDVLESHRPTSPEVVGSGFAMDMGMGMAMMCMAILGATLLALLQALRRPHLFVLSTRPRRTHVDVLRGRGPAPPALIALSIQRC